MPNWFYDNVAGIGKGKGKGKALSAWQHDSFNVEIENQTAHLSTKETVIKVRPKLSLGLRKRGK